MPIECSVFIGVGEGDVVVCDGVVGPGEGRRPAHVEEGAVDSCYHWLRRGGGSCKNKDYIKIVYHAYKLVYSHFLIIIMLQLCMPVCASGKDLW